MITIQKNVPLAPYTSFDIGGPAAFFVRVCNDRELREALLFAKQDDLPYCMLGGGTNLLISDQGFAGVVLKVAFDAVELTRNGVIAEAGTDLTALVQAVSARGLTGMESMAGIPGTLGGAVRGNAGAYGTCIADVLQSVQVLDAETGKVVTFTRDGCRFGYRSSHFKRNRNLIVLSAELALAQGSAEESQEKARHTIEKRLAKHLDFSKCVGSFFMNPLVTDPEVIRTFETEQKTQCREGRIPAGWIIDRVGLRNERVGNAMVSELHANYLINTGGATAAEVQRLAELVKERVRSALGVELMEEVGYLGFTPVVRNP
ncbi:UDP-N-acetylmuramate dehydrogenase [Geomesophilobacter sediminis]|uniref:UDP-N-acetylenolpyruvoylglucosamine reductase n=1 Tax=Geomesophilobacter sediminis TaxID=2798584 RepID=A0A8J7SBW2_9BACT|nr:UDP-N-acetylmuramate dehydrogenase [Geomesophilobacter sediminis]MBJ6728001.1 UDP-N-acetylmuramate dehydrogenase [Geomesophilobacter sediminis]